MSMKKQRQTNLLIRSSLAVALSLVISAPLQAQSGSSSKGKKAVEGKLMKIPAALPVIGELGENIYDLAKVDDWTKAADRLTSLREAVQELSVEAASAHVDKERLNQRIEGLGKAIPAKDRHAAMREANQVTLIAANLTAPFDPKVPVDVTRLDYYGRELEIWSTANDKDKLKATASDTRKTWDRLRPSVVTHNGAAEAREFDELLARVEAAKSPKEYSLVATPLLDAVDKLEKLYK
ncbi:MAG: hypothetical protein ABI651_05630 [Verrucomicrobiota bacterium]